MEKVMKIEGMMCKNCVAHVANALNGIEGVTAEVSLEKGTAVLQLAREIADETLKNAVEEEGYTVVSIR